MGGTSYTQGYDYDWDGTVTSVTTTGASTVSYTYDSLRRLKTASNTIYFKAYTYAASGSQTSGLVSNLTYSGVSGSSLPTMTFQYTYDNLGNILTASDPIMGSQSYTYDAQGQLTNATIGSSGSYAYTYDGSGNLLTASTPSGDHTYSYDNTSWQDLLTAYDNQSITYDASGNPTSYYNGTRWSMTWENGRELTKAVSTDHTITYSYDGDGVRQTKTVNGVKHEYVYASGKLLRETYGTTVLDFLYDQSGNPYAMIYNGTPYYYILNIQGDVVRLMSASGVSCGVYRYDAWGNITYMSDSEIANANPLRYRGYYYDSESGFYYCQSRYYDPEIGRFINADSFASTGQGFVGYNMFTYCNNNPVNYIDQFGHIPQNAFSTSLYEESWGKDPEETTPLSGTLSLGGSASIGIGPWAFSAQACVTVDSSGYVSFQYGGSGGISADPLPLGFSFSAAPYLMVSNAPIYTAIEGPGIQVGGAFTPIIIDYNAMLDETGQKILYHGFFVGVGATTPGFHVMWGETKTIYATIFDWETYYKVTQY